VSRTGPAAYQTVASDLRTAILQHRYDSGERLPTEAQLAARYQLSRQTVRRAFQDLVSDGLVYRVPGRGSFATPRDGQYVRHFGSIEDLMGLSLDTDLELLTPLTRRVDVAAAGRLQLVSDVVSTVSFRRRHEGQPFCVTDVYLPPSLGKRLEDVPELLTEGFTSRVTVIGLLDERLDQPITTADQSITAAAASHDVAHLLGVLAGQPVLRIDRIYSDGGDTPVELAVSYFRPDLYSYRLKLRRGTSGPALESDPNLQRRTRTTQPIQGTRAE
jgi:DNA-binding GntR family transcriptional regulator